MAQVTRVQCCAILELHGIHDMARSGLKGLLQALFAHYTPGGPTSYGGTLPPQIYSRPYIVLSYAVEMYGGRSHAKEGEEFIAWVNDNKMGELVVTKPHRNPSSNSEMVFILWMPDHGRLREYFLNTFVKPAWEEKLKIDAAAKLAAETLAAKTKAANDAKAAAAKEAEKKSIPGAKPGSIKSANPYADWHPEW